jgi:hypothetical protein
MLWIYRRSLRLTVLYTKVGEHLLDILVLVDRHRSIGLEVKLDPEEQTRGAQVVQSKFCFQCSLDLSYLVLVCRGNEKVINVNTNHAIGFV